MKIYLLDCNKEITDAWKKEFHLFPDVTIINGFFADFMNEHPGMAVVSPANSFGHMDGGYDKAIIDYFGKDMQDAVYNSLSVMYDGYQPIGTCMVVKHNDSWLLHCPTMRWPEEIIDPRVIFDCTVACLKAAYKWDLPSVVIPAFGGLTGGIEPEELALYMRQGFDFFRSIKNVLKGEENLPLKVFSWDYINFWKRSLRVERC